jgi:xanthine dehydrogenase accessory factor
MRVWARLHDALERYGKAAMVTVVSTKGSVPREAGARLVVHPDGAFSGTIGGGTLEWQAIALAQAALANPSTKRAYVRKFVLGPELGQCCGGQVELLVELIGETERAMVIDLAARERAGQFVTRASVSAERGVSREVQRGMDISSGRVAWHDGTLVEGFGDDPRPLLLFGAGHVGRALVLSLAQLPFAVTWIDQRPDAFPSHLPENVVAKRVEDPVVAVKAAQAGSFVLVMSHSHQLDLALINAALASERFPYVGLIGSGSKRARFEKRLAETGIARERIATLVCPIGVDGIRSKAPAMIAAATAAELLIRDEALRAREAEEATRTMQPKHSGIG